MTAKDSLEALTGRVATLLDLAARLKRDNATLRSRLDGFETDTVQQRQAEHIAALESEVQALKRENKQLKEKQKLVRNKVERLAVKLDELGD